MVNRERINQIKITLPLIALCLPLFANHYVTAQNGCPYETYLRLDNKCVDLSEQGLNNISQEIAGNAGQEVSKEVNEVSQELKELKKELKEFCIEDRPETSSQIEIMEDVCQY